MYPPGPYGVSRGSFQTPVTPPTTGPFDAPTFQVCVNRDWLPFIAGALKQLLLQASWIEMTPTLLLALQGNVFDLISAFGQIDAGCGAVVPPILCISGSFADLDYGFVPDALPLCQAVWVSGTGWTSCTDSGGNSTLNLTRDLANSFIRSYQLKLATNVLHAVDYTVDLFLNGSLVDTVTLSVVFGPTITINGPSSPTQADAMVITIANSAGNDGTPFSLTDFAMCYTGDFPLTQRVPGFISFTYVISHGITEGSGPSTGQVDGTVYHFSSGPSDPVNNNDYSLAIRTTACAAVHVVGLSGYSPPTPTSVFWSGHDNCAGMDTFQTGSNEWQPGVTENSQLIYMRSATPFSVDLSFT